MSQISWLWINKSHLLVLYWNYSRHWLYRDFATWQNDKEVVNGPFKKPIMIVQIKSTDSMFAPWNVKLPLLRPHKHTELCKKKASWRCSRWSRCPSLWSRNGSCKGNGFYNQSHRFVVHCFRWKFEYNKDE